ncbi:MAG TPA: hypothetical protein VFX49_21825 [Chloroflexota bacterium]|nr:hypothetical protein [Chloroflexota bacterium]
MASSGGPYVKWLEEEEDAPDGARRVRAAWLVRNLLDHLGERQELLAYLGQRPRVTPVLKEEVAALYPEIDVDWAAIERALSADPGRINVSALSDDELALTLRELAQERGLSLMDLALRLGYGQRQILPEVVRLLENVGNVARFERTSGSVFDYLVEKHLDYAFVVYKARLFFEGDEARLADVVRDEPKGFSDAAWRARREYWRGQLEAYRAAKRAPE